MNDMVTGILRREGNGAFILDDLGTPHFAGEQIWEGYIRHWLNTRVNARILPQVDYLSGRRIVLIWPWREQPRAPFIELYYNERLIKYAASTFGHIAANINGAIFNFSHLLNECEILTEEEYFYRPALGHFAPDPKSGRFNIDDPEKPYFDKFGRSFMRTIHIARIEGVETGAISSYYKNQLAIIHSTPSDPDNPEKYRDFNFFTRSCATIIRDGLRDSGYHGIKGVLPRDMFVSAVWEFSRLAQRAALSLQVFQKKQLMVDEAPPSAASPLINPKNLIKRALLRRRGINV